MEETSVSFPSGRNSGKIMLEGSLGVPDAGGLNPGVVLCHPHPAGGGEMCVPLLAVLADHLCSQGMVVLRFNFGGVGRSEGVFSDGADEPADVGAASDYLASLDEVDGDSVSIVGWSFGAWMALVALAEGLQARSLVAIAPPIIAYPWEGYTERLTVSAAARHYIVGDGDSICPFTSLEMFAAAVSDEDERNVHVLSGADHFLVGRENEVARLVDGIITR
ncbi:MAG: prolyl oligopeptidase family serine peptidase [Actinobacteria bacterium]|nr:prolyl oligopeptidase family serine peptidase [Actinomycetota bacterium]